MIIDSCYELDLQGSPADSRRIFDQSYFFVVLKGRCRALFSSLFLCYHQITASEL